MHYDPYGVILHEIKTPEPEISAPGEPCDELI